MVASIATPSRNIGIQADSWGRHQRYWGTIAVVGGGATYTTGGIVCSFAGVPFIPHTSVPVSVAVWSENGGADGYWYTYISGTTNANGLLQISASLTVAAGTGPVFVDMANLTAIPAAISGDTKIRFEAVWVHGT
jgi:hypothetical protein